MQKIPIPILIILIGLPILFLIFVLPKYLGSRQVIPPTYEEQIPQPPQETQPEVQPDSELPDKDQISGYEPIPRYPGSVMLDHSEISFGGPRTIFIRYGTKASFEEVRDWYLSSLPREGWKLNFNLSPSPERIDLNFVKEKDVVVQITIEKGDTFTTIHIGYVEQK